MNPKLPVSLAVLVTLAIAAGCSRGLEPVVTQPGPAVETPSIAAALASAATWTIERGMLDMHRADRARAPTARAVE